MPKYLREAIPNFLGGLAVAIVIALAQWLSVQYTSVGSIPFIQIGLIILWILWVIWMGFVILWAFNRYRHSRNELSAQTSAEVKVMNNPATQMNEKKQSSQYHSCFISYSSKDEAFARQLHDDLENAGVACWFAPDDMEIGAKIRQAIEDSIHGHSKLLLILSKNSIQSDWVAAEVETVFEIEGQHKGVLLLFPIRLDDTVMNTTEAWAAHIRRTRNMGDFQEWQNPEVYQRRLSRVLRDLKKSGDK